MFTDDILNCDRCYADPPTKRADRRYWRNGWANVLRVTKVAPDEQRSPSPAAHSSRSKLASKVVGNLLLWFFAADLSMLFAGPASNGHAPSSQKGSEDLQLEKLRQEYITPSYKAAAVNLMLDEVNRAVRELQLPEHEVLSEADLTEAIVAPPFLAEHGGMFATVRTARFSYSAALGNKLCYIVKVFPDGDNGRAADLGRIKDRYARPKAQVTPDSALELARGWLRQASVDVEALDRDSTVEVSQWNLGDRAVPLYFVRWIQPKMSVPSSGIGQLPGEPVAFVELLEPERELRSLRVSKPQYIKRRRLIVPDWQRLLAESDDPNIAKMWLMTPDYKKAAGGLMLDRVNQVVARLRLADSMLVESNVAESMIETPFFSRKLGRFGTICSSNYVYSATAGNKLNYIRKNFRNCDEGQYRESLKSQYLSDRSRIDTRAAHSLASKWLEDFGVNVPALEACCKSSVTACEIGGKVIPLYRVIWTAGSDEPVAEVELLEPEKLLQLLWVHDTSYLWSTPFLVTDPLREGNP